MYGVSVCSPLRFDRHDLDDAFEATEVINVAGVDGKVGRCSCGGDQQVYGPLAARLASSRNDRREYAAIGPGRRSVERYGFQGRFHPLKALLSYSPLTQIFGCMDARGQFGQRDRRNTRFLR